MGRYHVKVSYPFHPTKEKTFVLKRGKQQQIVMEPLPLSWLQIKSQPPGSWIKINGIKRSPWGFSTRCADKTS